MSTELSCVTTDHKSSIRVGRKTLIRWYFGVLHCLSLVTRLMIVMFSMGWCRATNISICSGSQVTDRMTTWQGRGMCDGEINLFGTNLDKNHSLYRRLPRSCAIPRAFWTRVEAIRCNYPGRKHRKVRISSLIIERRIAFTLETGPGQGQRQNIAREYWNGGLKIKWTDLCVQRLFYFTVLLKLWVKGQGHKGEFLRCWLMGIRSCVCIV